MCDWGVTGRPGLVPGRVCGNLGDSRLQFRDNRDYGWGDHGSGGYLKADGSVPLDSTWDTGDGTAIYTDQIRARDGDGLSLFEDGGTGICFYRTQEVSREDWIGNGLTDAVIDNSGNVARGGTETVSGDSAGKDAIALTTKVTFLNTVGGTSDLTLAVGAAGQEKIITMTVSGNDAAGTCCVATVA